MIPHPLENSPRQALVLSPFVRFDEKPQSTKSGLLARTLQLISICGNGEAPEQLSARQ